MAGRGYRIRQYTLGTAVVLAAGLTVLLWRVGFRPLYAWLAGVNVVTLLLYGHDKRQAIVGRHRIPEVALHAAALLGGSLGAVVGQGLFRHKTRKVRFQAVFVAIVVLQIVGVYVYWRFVRP